MTTNPMPEILTMPLPSGSVGSVVTEPCVLPKGIDHDVGEQEGTTYLWFCPNLDVLIVDGASRLHKKFSRAKKSIKWVLENSIETSQNEHELDHWWDCCDKVKKAAKVMREAHKEGMNNGVVLDGSCCQCCKKGEGVTKVGKKGLFFCSLCREAKHCSDKCWHAAWPEHKKTCCRVKAATNMATFMDRENQDVILDGCDAATSCFSFDNISFSFLGRNEFAAFCDLFEKANGIDSGVLVKSVVLSQKIRNVLHAAL